MNANEINEMIIGWRPSRARANWRVRQLSMTPRLRQDMSEIVTLYDDLVKEAIPCCFVYCTAILHILHHRSATNPRIRRLFRSGRIYPYIKNLITIVLGGVVHSIEHVHRIFIQNMCVTRSMLPTREQYTSPPKNRTIDSMTDSDAYLFTRFTKEELHKLFVHLRLPLGMVNVMGHKPNQYRHFTSEEIFLLSLTKLAHGLSWVLMGRSLFGAIPTILVLHSVGLLIMCL